MNASIKNIWKERADGKVEVRLRQIPEGHGIIVRYKEKPVFVRHLTKEEQAEDGQNNLLLAGKNERVLNPAWGVFFAFCTHLGAVPFGNEPEEKRGDFGGWFCPCHGSHFDVLGRVRQGPASRDLDIPPYKFSGPGASLLIIG